MYYKMNLKDIKANYNDPDICNFPKASMDDINKRTKLLNHGKATAADKVKNYGKCDRFTYRKLSRS